MSLPLTTPKPEWLKIRPPGGENYSELKKLIHGLKLHTVCEEAACPNVAECWGGGTATIMLMGDTCTRGCKFCNIKSGNPHGVLDHDEPDKVAYALSKLKLTYVVLTSVDRDDLPDGGADHFARTIEAIKQKAPGTIVEALTPDFRGKQEDIERVVHSGVDVLSHNIETVERLTKKVRDGRCNYRLSIGVLETAKKIRPGIYTKSSIMLGLGEQDDEVLCAMDDLRKASVDILTIGQYLRPSSWHIAIEEYVKPEKFKMFEAEGLRRGFMTVPSGPLIRSSYRAGEKFLEALLRSNRP